MVVCGLLARRESRAYPHRDVCMAAPQALAEIGEAAVEPLSAVLQDEDAWVRYAAATAVGHIGDEPVLPHRDQVARNDDRAWGHSPYYRIHPS